MSQENVEIELPSANGEVPSSLARLHMALKEVMDAGPDAVVAVVHETARLKQTEMLVERDLAQVLTLHDGKVTRLRLFRTKQEALEAVGLRE